MLDADHRPNGHNHTEIVRNLRWRISSFIDDELRSRSTRLIDYQRPWAKVHELLDDRTVLLTWFLSAVVSGGAVLLAVTGQGRDLDEADANSNRHPVADQDGDGGVFAYDFLEADLRGVRLVILAACESARGRFDRADNVRGIPSALIARQLGSFRSGASARGRRVSICPMPARPVRRPIAGLSGG
ncbi:CHAT domain-containing protein [Streptomyces cavernicola]|uniref:CHAT domain-containing protein n=1 Tax=Streptomyces cavernicola TaxID=3043613 RepID=UPI0032B83EED